jgi:hypothetical protein
LIDPTAAVELVGGPLQLFDRGWWVPGDEYWGEVDGAVPVPLVEVAAAGARRGFEFEQLLPGGDDPDPRDPIEEAIALRDAGQPRRAVDLLEGLVEWDSRCLDAHAHLAFSRLIAVMPGAGCPTTRRACASRSGRCRRTSMECWAGDGWATVLSCAVCTG